MSHRAIVAVETGDGTYDIHYSHNGGFELQLVPVLQDHLAGKTTDIEAVANARSRQLPQIQKWGAASDIERDGRVELEGPDSQALDPQPMAQDVPEEHIGAVFDFDDIEAFYRVANGTVETYYPVWLFPNVIRPWRDELTVTVYTAGKLPDDPRQMVDDLEDTDPVRVLDDETLTGAGWTDDTIVWDVMLRNHVAVYAEQRRVARNEDFTERHTEFHGQSLLTTSSHVLVIDGPVDHAVTPEPQAAGVLVRVEDHQWSKYTNIRDTVQESRLESGTRLNFLDDDPSTEDIADEQKQMLIEILKSYREQVAPFSPPPYGPLAEQVSSLLDS